MLAGHDVQEHLDAGEVLACVDGQRKCVGGVLGVIGLHPMHIEVKMLGKVERSFVVESLGDDDGRWHRVSIKKVLRSSMQEPPQKQMQNMARKISLY